MTQPENQSTPKSSSTVRTARWIIIGLCLAALSAGAIFLGPQLTNIFAPPIPTPQCVQPTLTLGAAKFRIESIARAADGSLALPSGSPDVAYWVEGANINYVFALIPAPNNLALETTLKSGDEATIVWADCGSEEYVIKTVEVGQPDDSSLFDQSAAGITVFVQASSSAESLIIRSGRPEAPPADTPGPDENEIQAEVSFLETTASPDGATVRLSISIKNTGPTAFSLAMDEISLTAENAAPLAPLGVEPALPREIQPGASETFSITFPRPAVNTAVFKILDFSVDIFF